MLKYNPRINPFFGRVILALLPQTSSSIAESSITPDHFQLLREQAAIIAQLRTTVAKQSDEIAMHRARARVAPLGGVMAGNYRLLQAAHQQRDGRGLLVMICTSPVDRVGDLIAKVDAEIHSTRLDLRLPRGAIITGYDVRTSLTPTERQRCGDHARALVLIGYRLSTIKPLTTALAKAS
jgi:hypothetical protein